MGEPGPDRRTLEEAAAAAGIEPERVDRIWRAAGLPNVVLAPRSVLASVLHVPHPFTVALLGAMFVVVGASAYAFAAVGEKALTQLRRLRPN